MLLAGCEKELLKGLSKKSDMQLRMRASELCLYYRSIQMTSSFCIVYCIGALFRVISPVRVGPSIATAALVCFSKLDDDDTNALIQEQPLISG
jgi:hypothetical protein